MKKVFASIIGRLKKRFFDKDLEIENKLSNLIMLCTCGGCFIAFFISFFVNYDVFAMITIFIAFCVVAFCLYLSAWKHKHKLASILVISLINGLIFPFMYMACGGIHSGMACWLIVGLIFPFLVLHGPICIIIFIASALMFIFVAILEYKGITPLPITPLEGASWVEDVIQSMILVSLVFGIIFKFQAKIYDQQSDEIKQRQKELSESNEKLERASKAKSDFLANMSHEIRTPINAIMGMNEIIIRDSDDPVVIQNSIKIQTASNNLLSIVNDILDFSKIEAGKMEILPAEYQLSSLLNDCYNVISLRAFNKGLDFKITNDPEIPERVFGDIFRIRQIVTNLLTNAVKYTREGFCELNVTYEKVAEDKILIHFAVKDSGVGISEKDKKLLFNSFQRIDETHNRSIEGTGLGLTISARLAAQMGGSISVESEYGKGSIFTATIPQTFSGNEKIGEFSKRYEEYENQKKHGYKEELIAPDVKILAIDDVKMNLDVIKGLLKKTKITIDTALNGKDALELTQTNTYDLIFLDHMMPEMDGVETLHRLKKLNNSNFNTPVIALTANAIIGAKEQYLQEGFDGYLSKPVHGKDLEEAIEQFISPSRIKKD